MNQRDMIEIAARGARAGAGTKLLHLLSAEPPRQVAALTAEVMKSQGFKVWRGDLTNFRGSNRSRIGLVIEVLQETGHVAILTGYDQAGPKTRQAFDAALRSSLRVPTSQRTPIILITSNPRVAPAPDLKPQSYFLDHLIAAEGEDGLAI